MSEHTPTEDEVREEWAYGAQDLDMDGNVVVSFDEAVAQFDRFIGEVKAKAWDEAFNATCDAHDVYGGLNYEPRNPYREANDE